MHLGLSQLSLTGNRGGGSAAGGAPAWFTANAPAGATDAMGYKWGQAWLGGVLYSGAAFTALLSGLQSGYLVDNVGLKVLADGPDDGGGQGVTTLNVIVPAGAFLTKLCAMDYCLVREFYKYDNIGVGSAISTICNANSTAGFDSQIWGSYDPPSPALGQAYGMSLTSPLYYSETEPWTVGAVVANADNVIVSDITASRVITALNGGAALNDGAGVPPIDPTGSANLWLGCVQGDDPGVYPFNGAYQADWFLPSGKTAGQVTALSAG